MTAATKKRGRPSKAELKEQKSYDKLTKAVKAVPSKRVYICSPYKGNIKRNTVRTQIYCRFAYDSGFVPIAPHIYFTQFLDENSKTERAAGMKYGLELLWQCRELWVFGCNITDGMRAEIELARDLKIPIKYYDEDTLER
jgi:hypothetical protein